MIGNEASDVHADDGKATGRAHGGPATAAPTIQSGRPGSAELAASEITHFANSTAAYTSHQDTLLA
jgi:hypothetical protein